MTVRSGNLNAIAIQKCTVLVYSSMCPLCVMLRYGYARKSYATKMLNGNDDDNDDDDSLCSMYQSEYAMLLHKVQEVTVRKK